MAGSSAPGDDPQGSRELRILAVDHRWQLEEAADELGVDRGRLRGLKVLLGRAFRRVAEEDEAAGVLIDDVYGDEALEELTGSGAWISRAVEVAKSRPVEFVGGPNVAATLRAWPEEHVVKCNLYMHPEDDEEMREIQEQRVLQLYDACLVERPATAARGPGLAGDELRRESVARLIGRFYEIGVRPEWWKVPPNPDPAVWARIGDVVREHDPYCAGLARPRAGDGGGAARRELRRRGLRAAVPGVRHRALHLRGAGPPLAGRRDRRRGARLLRGREVRAHERALAEQGRAGARKARRDDGSAAGTPKARG